MSARMLYLAVPLIFLLVATDRLTRAQERAESLGAPRPLADEGQPRAAALSLPDLVGLALQRNPALQQASLGIEEARGRAIQAGLYPNPTVSAMGEELGGRDGPGGFITAPMVSQEIVTARKLTLSRAVAERSIDRAGLILARERLDLVTAIRRGFFAVLAAQRRVEILQQLVRLAGESVAKSKELLAAKEIAELDTIPFLVDRDRFEADLEASRRELTAAWQRLVATVGEPKLPYGGLNGSLEAPLPLYEYDQVRDLMVLEHPEVLIAQVGIQRAQAALHKERALRIPNVTVAAGYTRDNIGRQPEWTFQAGLPVPLFDRNQGNIHSAQAELAQAEQETARVQNALASRLASAFGDYAAARQREVRYRTSIMPLAERAYKFSLEAFKAGQFEFLRVLQAQRSLAEARLEYNRALLDAWQAASELAGLSLEEYWCVEQQ